MGKEQGKMDMLQIKFGWFGKTRLFFNVLNNPWQTVQTLLAFGEEQRKLDAEIIALQEKHSKILVENIKLKEKIYTLKHGGKD